MSEAFFVSKAFFENAFEKIKRFREKTIVRKNDTGSTLEQGLLKNRSNQKTAPVTHYFIVCTAIYSRYQSC